jgi:hypothetical protein
MTVTESKALKKGARVYWRGNAADSGTVTATSWDAVTIIEFIFHSPEPSVSQVSRSS